MNSYQNNKIKLEIDHLVKDYEETKVLEDLHMIVHEGEFVTIVGPSGCGKSTLFNIIAGLDDTDSGAILFEGVDKTGEIGHVSYMYQKDLLLPWKKVIDNAALPLLAKGMKKKVAREKVEPYFEQFGLAGFEYKYPEQLSGGMRQRVSLLRTYMAQKDIMLLDEPFGGLDAITKSKMQDWLLEILRDLNVSILFITHDIEEAIYLSDRIYVFSDRPAMIKKEFVIDLEKPRHRDITTTHAFNEIKREILEIL